MKSIVSLLIITLIAAVYGRLRYLDICVHGGPECDTTGEAVPLRYRCKCRKPTRISVIGATWTSWSPVANGIGYCCDEEGTKGNCLEPRMHARANSFFGDYDHRGHDGYDIYEHYDNNNDGYFGFIAVIVSMFSFGLATLAICGCICIILVFVGYKVMNEKTLSQSKRRYEEI